MSQKDDCVSKERTRGRRRLPCLFCLALYLAAFGGARPVIAQAQPVLQGLDILFLVDQSGSMGGRPFGSATNEKPSDVLGLRFQAVQYALRTLSEYRKVVAPGFSFKMAVISFGDQSEVVLDWTEIDALQASWSTTEAHLLDQLSQDSFGKRNLNATNFLSAYRAAQQLFEALPSPGANQMRMRAIVTLTDGAPCVPAEFHDKSCANYSDQYNHMNQLIKLATDVFQPASYRLYVIGIDNKNTYWSRLEPFWTKVVGANGIAQRVENSTQVGQVFLQILADLARVAQTTSGANRADSIGQVIPIGNINTSIMVPPYQESLRITVFKTQASPGISLVDASGTRVTEQLPNVKVSGIDSPIEVWKINNPTPGMWTIVATQPITQLNVYRDLIYVPYKLEVGKADMLRYERALLTLTLLDTRGQPLPEYTDPRYRLASKVVMHTPSGSIETITLSPNRAGIYTGEFTPSQAGDYVLDVEADTQNPDGSALKVIDQAATQRLTISDLNLDVKTEPSGDMLLSQQMAITARLLDDKGNARTIDALSIVASISSGQGSAGQTGATTYTLVSDSSGAYTAGLTMDTIGQYQIAVRATTKDVAGNIQVVGEKYLPVFQVKPTQLVEWRISEPQPDSTFYVTEGFPPLRPARLKIEVMVSDDKGQPMNLSQLAGGRVPLLIQVSDSAGKDVAQDVRFSSGEQVGTYQAELAGLSPGPYRVQIRADESARLGESTLFDPRFKVQSVPVTAVIHPGFVLTIAVIVLTIGVSVGGSSFLAVRHVRRRSHPATGRLDIVHEDFSLSSAPRSSIWHYSLDAQHSNHIVVTRGLPPDLKRLIVECPDNKMSQQGQAYITLECSKGKKRVLLNHVRFSRNTERRLDGISDDNNLYYLVKDYEEY